MVWNTWTQFFCHVNSSDMEGRKQYYMSGDYVDDEWNIKCWALYNT